MAQIVNKHYARRNEKYMYLTKDFAISNNKKDALILNSEEEAKQLILKLKSEDPENQIYDDLEVI